MASGLYIFLGFLSGYVGTSTLFFFFPALLHKKKKPPFKATHISHRGGAAERLENTIEAFRNSASRGTEMFEIDVQLTKDREVVVSHDDDLTRITGWNVMISECNYDDLPPISSTLDVTFEPPGTVCSRPESEGRIALLRSLLQEFPDIALNIDTKTNDDVIEPTIRLIREYKRENNVVMANFRNDAINKIHAIAPELMLGMSPKRMLIITLSFYLGLLPFLPIKECYCELFLPSSLRHLGRFKNWQIRVLDALFMRPALFRHLQRRGIQVYLFIVNDEEDFEYCFNVLGVDGIMTDYPAKLEAYLKYRNSKSNNEGCPLLEGEKTS